VDGMEDGCGFIEMMKMEVDLFSSPLCVFFFLRFLFLCLFFLCFDFGLLLMVFESGDCEDG
jgi:membrane-anchored glycerophosphoryl diester phosphodiesterase (GDPDase)